MNNELFEIQCCECGIVFAIRKNVQIVWAQNNKMFFCPNGHSQLWRTPTLSVKEQTELKCLRLEVQELKDKLATALNHTKGLVSKLEVPQPVDSNKEF